MAQEPVFYSFHYDNDANRAQLIRDMGVLEVEDPVQPSEWDTIKQQGDVVVQQWIDDSMASKKCVVVLIGSETSQRPWVKHEIRRAWETKKGLLGIYIHNLKYMSAGLCSKGPNPFTNWTVGSQSLASLVSCYDPPALDAYHRIARSLSSWVAIAIDEARSR